MNRQIKVSVIVPVYNVKKYLKQCMESIRLQTLKEIEIICVDDGSTDGSAKILKRYQEKDDRFIVLEQSNLYAGVARNTGLEHASGKYVIFWDSDDYFRTDALEILYDQAEKTQAQVCVCNAFKYDETLDATYSDPLYLRADYLPEKEVFNRNTIPGYIFNFTSNVPWNKLYLRAFIEKNGLRFQSLRRANDVYFVMMSLYLADKITVVHKRLMFYRTANEQSLTGKSGESLLCTVQAFSSVKEALEREGHLSGDLQRSFVNKAAGPLINTLEMLKSLNEFKELFLAYKNSVLIEIGAWDREETYYYSRRHYDILHHIQKDCFEDFLFWYAISENARAQNWKVLCKVSRRETETVQDKLDELRASTAYRVGRTVTWVPRNVKEEMKKKGIIKK